MVIHLLSGTGVRSLLMANEEKTQQTFPFWCICVNLPSKRGRFFKRCPVLTILRQRYKFGKENCGHRRITGVLKSFQRVEQVIQRCQNPRGPLSRRKTMHKDQKGNLTGLFFVRRENWPSILACFPFKLAAIFSVHLSSFPSFLYFEV